MQGLEVSGAVRPIYGSLGVKRLIVSSCLSDRIPPIRLSAWRNFSAPARRIFMKFDIQKRVFFEKKSVEKLQDLLKSDHYNGHVT